MKKRILGLDLGTTSIGWALVEEERNENKRLTKSNIIKLGVRVNPLSVDEKLNFEKGQTITTNADRTLKRSMRRNLQRFKLRRAHLKSLLVKNEIISENSKLTESGKNTTHETLKLRAKAVHEEISLVDFARVLFAINKKRGYKSSRKTVSDDEGIAIDGMSIAKHLYENQETPGQFVLKLLEETERKYVPDFYRSDLQNEFDLIWNRQAVFYPELLTEALYHELQNKNKSQTWAICREPFGIVGIKLPGKQDEQKLQQYRLRVLGLTEKLDLEHLAIALQEVNGDKNKSSGYLGEISDRSKILYTEKLTVGEFLWSEIKRNPHTSLKRKVFYRQDYLDEFEQIWETQAKFHPQLNNSLKEQIRDTIIFYQRKLKSQKGLISFCEFESWQETRKDENGSILLNKQTGLPKTRTVGYRVVPKSSPLFQEFRIWQNLNNLKISHKETKEELDFDEDAKTLLFKELNLRRSLTEKQALKLIGLSDKEWKTNQTLLDAKKGSVKPIEGNRTNATLFEIYQEIAHREGYAHDWSKMTANEILEELSAVFQEIGIDPGILTFNANLEGPLFDKQASYQLWHLLYSAEDDHRTSEDNRLVYGNSDVNLKKALHTKFGFPPDYAKLMAKAKFEQDYGSLSARAIRRILPEMQAGFDYSQACQNVGYNHSKSFTREELKNRVLKSSLELLPKNSLRNPVVEKILNQMINLINQICDTYGKPDEIRIELARELKKNAKQRGEATKAIAAATKQNEDLKKRIQSEFGFMPTRNDLIRYKLWQELVQNGGRTFFTDQKIEAKDLFSSKVDIEHIIPKALLFDDSFSNKTLAFRDVNQAKNNRTAFDFIAQDHQSELEAYTQRVVRMYESGAISKSKRNKLLMPATELPKNFIERDLRNSQYIAKKAKELLQDVFETVVPTSGSITDRLREDWGLINVMKELNFAKYKALGLTETHTRWDSGRDEEKEIEVIKDWTKRNDHRHHAMDALAVAFTSHNHIQYINYLNARFDSNHEKHANINAIEQLIRKEGKFTPPMENFRTVAKMHIESILVSHKAKNKVVTRNTNAAKGVHSNRIQLTPRGQLHKETVYGKIKRPLPKPVRLSKKFEINQAQLIVNPNLRRLVLKHLSNYSNKPTIAFDTKTLKKDPLNYKGKPLTEVNCFEEVYTIRKDINPENFKDEKTINKVIDPKVRALLSQRLKEYGGNPKLAFSDLDKQPIWLNKENGLCIKRASITGVTNAEALHLKKDHFGKEIKNAQGEATPVDFVSTGNNHHVAIFKDSQGNLQEEVVSFYEVVARVNQGAAIIRKNHPEHPDWEFQFTMKQNEFFVFPNEAQEFNPMDCDLINPANAAKISPNLFRVQKIATKNYFFRHHLETEIIDTKETRGINWENIRSCNNLIGIVKVRMNHLGTIVKVGEE